MNEVSKASCEQAVAQAAACDDRMVKVHGPAGCGKTEVLVQRCVRLVEGGSAPTDILFTTPTSLAAGSARKRLRAAFAARHLEDADDIAVASALDACVGVLDTPAARAATKRVPRLLNDAEYKFFLEDMRTLGQPARRLRGMLSFFFRQWANLAPREEWLVGGEEEAVFEHALLTLELRGAMLCPEAPYLCENFLSSDAGAKARGGFSHVLADDFQNLSRAEQTCLCLLAKEQIVVCGNVNETVAERGAHPHPDGFAQFDALRRDVRVFTLENACGNRGIVSFAGALCSQKGMDPAFAPKGVCEAISADNGECGAHGSPFPCGATIVKWLTPEDEIDGLTKYVRALADAEEGAAGSRTCVVVPNRQWAHMVGRVLAQRGFEVSAAGADRGLGGDPRESARAKAQVAYTLLNLLADPADMTAWRSWCGFDNYLTNSDAWSGLQKYACARSLSLAEALDKVAKDYEAGASEPFLRAFALAERWTAGHELLRKHAGRKGFALLRAAGAEGLREFEEIERAMAGDESAAQAFALVRTYLNRPAFPAGEHVLHVSTYKNLAGLKYDNVLMFACIDGFMPHRDAFELVSTDEDRDRIMNAERRAFYRAAAAATKRLIVSYFAKAPLEVAERSKMQVARIRSEGNERMALVRPSAFLAETEGMRPSTIGGQTLLSETGLG